LGRGVGAPTLNLAGSPGARETHGKSYVKEKAGVVEEGHPEPFQERVIKKIILGYLLQALGHEKPEGAGVCTLCVIKAVGT